MRKKNIYLTILLLVAVLLGIVYFNSMEGFQARTTNTSRRACNASNCTGDYEWVGGKCVLRCSKIWTGSSQLQAGSWSCKNTGYGRGQQVLSRNSPQYIKVNC